MPPLFIRENVGKNLEDYDCLATTGYNEDEIIGLTGANVASVGRRVCITGYYPSIRVSVEHSDFYCSRSIDFENAEIHNEMLTVKRRRRGLGFKIFDSQVYCASEADFTAIHCMALGDKGSIERYNGYITWGRLGFTMAEHEQEEFTNFLRKHNRTETSLFDLLLTADGRALWEEEGYSWFGDFFLKEGSKNRYNLDVYRSLSI